MSSPRREAGPRNLRRTAPSARRIRPAARLWTRSRRGSGRRRRSLRERLLSEHLRQLLSTTIGLLVGLAAVIPLAARTDDTENIAVPLSLVLLIVMMSVYTLASAGMTLYGLSGASRTQLIAAARLPRARRQVRVLRWWTGRATALDEVFQMLVIAVIAVLLLIHPPPYVPVAALLALTAAAVVTAWIGSVMTFALEYAAEDAHGEAFTLPGTIGSERSLAEYLYGSVQIQASSGASDLTPLTAAARRLVRSHLILSHVTSTIIITLGVSAVVTAVA